MIDRREHFEATGLKQPFAHARPGVNHNLVSASFDQDLMIKKIPNFTDTVWFGPHTEPDGSDASYCWVLTGLDPEDFKARYPERSESASVSADRDGNAYYHRHEQIMVGRYLYLKEESRVLVEMSDGRVYEEDEDFLESVDELAMQGIT